MTSLAYYQTHADDYFRQTFSVDPSTFLLPLTRHLCPGSRILDIGCGSGRDMLWLKKRGFACFGLEISPTLSALAHKHTGLPVIEADFTAYDFSQMDMDAILLIGALVHLPHKEFSRILARILKALKSEGYILITIKKGQGTKTLPDGRTFYLWEKEDLWPIFNQLGLICIESSVQISQVRQSETWISFVLQM